MPRFLIYSAILAVPLLMVGCYAKFFLVLPAPISELSVEKAGQFGDSFGIITCLFSGLAFSGILITLLLQRDELKMQREEIERNAREHALNTRLTALAALLGVYHELADKKQSDLDQCLAKPSISGETGAIEERFKKELDGIQSTRNKIYDELERAAGLKCT